MRHHPSKFGVNLRHYPSKFRVNVRHYCRKFRVSNSDILTNFIDLEAIYFWKIGVAYSRINVNHRRTKPQSAEMKTKGQMVFFNLKS